jgi:hypothetical protein
MKFNEAIQKLKEGKRVRRPVWDKDSYWKLGLDETICWKDGTSANIHINQIEANDWEVEEDLISHIKANII